jgi:hypothetical protein
LTAGGNTTNASRGGRRGAIGALPPSVAAVAVRAQAETDVDTDAAASIRHAAHDR